MDIWIQHDWNISAWQATDPVFIRHFKDNLMLATNGTECADVQVPKGLTTGAISMIVVITIFIVLAILGSISTAYEFLCEKNNKKKTNNKSDSKNVFFNLFQKDIEKTLSNVRNNKDCTYCLPQNDTEKKPDYEAYNKDCTNNLPLSDKEKNYACKGWLIRSRIFLTCFCLIKNGKKLFQTDSNKDQFECFHGLRFISNFFIICFHIGAYYGLTRKNMDKAKPLLQSPISYLLLNTCLAVNVFFILSGFLNAYLFSREYGKNNGKIYWWYFYLKRLVRLTPAHMIVLGFHTTLLNYTGSGPVWPEYVTNPVCKENWWWNLLYINNFQSSLKMCMLWCWYLAVDMQLYVVSPIFLLSLLRWPRFGYGLASTTISLSCLSNFVITKQYNLIGFSKFVLYLDDLRTFTDRFWLYVDKLYVKPYSRINSYLIGMLLGYYFYKRNCLETRNNWITLCCGWITAGILLWISIFALFYTEQSVLETAFHHSVKDLFFSVGLSWIIYVCLTGQGDFINSFLCWKLFFPFSKLSYCAYLIHVLILQRDYQAAQDLEEFSFSLLALNGLKVYFWTFVISIPVSLLFEMPMISLLDLFMKKRRN